MFPFSVAWGGGRGEACKRGPACRSNAKSDWPFRLGVLKRVRWRPGKSRGQGRRTGWRRLGSELLAMWACGWVGGTGVWSRKEKGIRSRRAKRKFGEAGNRTWSTEIIRGDLAVHSLSVEPGGKGESCAEEGGLFPGIEKPVCLGGRFMGIDKSIQQSFVPSSPPECFCCTLVVCSQRISLPLYKGKPLPLSFPQWLKILGHPLEVAAL